MRATRFRLQAGLLSWKKRMGSDIRNAGILSFIPNECKYPQVNSTESFRDLTQAEQDSIEKTLKGTAPGRKRNDHPDKNGKKEPVEDDEDAEGDSVGGDFEVTAYAKTPTRVLVKTQQSVNSASSQQSKMKHKSQHNNDSDFSGNESDKPIVKRQRIHGPMKGANTPQHAAINDTSVRRSSRRVTLPRQQVESRPDNTNMSNEPEDDLGAEEESGESSESKPAKYITQEAQDIITGPDPLTARIVNAAAMNGQYTRTTRKSTASAKTNPIPAGKDIRIVVPTIDPENIEENMASLQAALDLTRLDYFKKTGWRPPPSLVKEHKDLSYTLQWHALQKMFAQAYRGEERPAPHLYLLPRWEGTFQDWEPHDEEGQQLLLEST